MHIDAKASAVRVLLTLGLFTTAIIATPQESVGPEVIKSSFGAMLVLVALVVWLWGGLSQRVVLWHPFLYAPIFLALYALLSAFWSPTGTALIEAGRWALIAIIIFLVLNTTRRNYFETVVQLGYWVCVGLSLLALAQFWLGLEWFPASAAPGSTFGNRNFFAEFLSASLPLSLWMLGRRQTMVSGLRTGFGFALIAVALMSTGTRAALIAAIIGIVAMIILLSISRHKSFFLAPRRVLLTAFALVLLTVMALGSIPSTNDDILRDHAEMQVGLTAIERTVTRLGSLSRSDTYEDDSSFGIRRAGWFAAKQMIENHPFKGIGAGAWNSVSPLYMPEHLEIQLVWMAHNEPLQIIVEYGLVGWAALLSFFVFLCSTSLRNLRQLRGASRLNTIRSLRQMVIALSIVTMGLTSLSGLPLHAAATCYLLSIYLGMLAKDSPIARRFTTPRRWTGAMTLPKVTGLCLLAVAIFTSIQAMRFDYYVRQGVGALQGLAKTPSSQNSPRFAALLDQALANLNRGLAIYPEHTLLLLPATGYLINLNEYEKALDYIKKVLEHTPHLTTSQCQKVQTYANLRRFDEADIDIERIASERPNAACLPITQFVLAYKKEDFSQATALGKFQIAKIKAGDRRNEARYLVDYTYRAAIRISDWDTALKALALRAHLWPELRASSWLLAGRLQAGLAPNQFSPEALNSFKKALSASTTSERQQILRDLPAVYRDAM